MDPLNSSFSSSSSSSSSIPAATATAASTSTHIHFADQSSTSNSKTSPLIDHPEPTMTQDYGSTSNSTSNSRPSPGTLNLPTSPYAPQSSRSTSSRSQAASEADASISSPLLHPRSDSRSNPPILSPSATGLSNRPRGFSFKRSNRPSQSSTTPNFLKRASIAITGRDRDRTSFSSSTGGPPDSRWKNLRRFKTTSINGREGTGPRINQDEDPFTENGEVKPHVPSMLPNKKSDSTPIPMLPFVVLCLMIFGECE